MLTIDLGLLLSWIVPGFVGLLFGVVGSYVTYRFERRRDNLQWEQEKLKLAQQWQQERERVEISWQQKLQELQIQFMREDQNRLREQLLKGVDNPTREIEIMGQWKEVIQAVVRLHSHSEEDRLYTAIVVAGLHGKDASPESIRWGLAYLDQAKALFASDAEGKYLSSTDAPALPNDEK